MFIDNTLIIPENVNDLPGPVMREDMDKEHNYEIRQIFESIKAHKKTHRRK